MKSFNQLPIIDYVAAEHSSQTNEPPRWQVRREKTTEFLEIGEALQYSEKASKVTEIAELAKEFGLGDVDVIRSSSVSGILGPDTNPYRPKGGSWVYIIGCPPGHLTAYPETLQLAFLLHYMIFEFQGSRLEIAAAVYAFKHLTDEPFLPDVFLRPRHLTMEDNPDWWNIGQHITNSDALKIIRIIARSCRSLNLIPIVLHVVRCWLDLRPDSMKTTEALVRAFEQDVPFQSASYIRRYYSVAALNR